MTPLDAIVLARADEQMRTIRMDEPTKHDRRDVPGAYVPRMRFRRGRCLACGGQLKGFASYCPIHKYRIENGYPWDLENWSLTKAERRRLSSGVRWGRAG